MDQKNILLAGALLIILILFAYILWPDSEASPVADVASSTAPITALVPPANGGTVVTQNVPSTPTTPVKPAIGGARTLENNVWVTEVVFTDSGFSPATLQVQAGEEVRFVNRSSGAMRIIANTKDSSDYYKLINQPTTVAKGKSFQISLFKAGLFIYSNPSVQWNPGGSITIY